MRDNEVLHERFSRLSEASLRINESDKTPEASGTIPPKELTTIQARSYTLFQQGRGHLAPFTGPNSASPARDTR